MQQGINGHVEDGTVAHPRVEMMGEVERVQQQEPESSIKETGGRSRDGRLLTWMTTMMMWARVCVYAAQRPATIRCECRAGNGLAGACHFHFALPSSRGQLDPERFLQFWPFCNVRDERSAAHGCKSQCTPC